MKTDYLLEIFPEAVSSFVKSPSIHPRQPMHKAYPLHLACYNEHCPGTVIQLLIKEDPALCKVKGKVRDDNNTHSIFAPAQLPVHYYLSRNVNVDIGTVKVFDTKDQGPGYYPIHALLSNSNINHMQDILQYLVNAEPLSLLETDQGRLPLNIACCNKAVNLSIVELLFNSIPERNRNLIDGHNKHPIHELSLNSKLDDDVSLEILRFMLDIDPTISQVRDTIKIPIHYAVGHGNKSLEFCKLLIDAYPESLKVEALFNGSLPIHEACGHGYRDDTVDTIQYMLDLYPEGMEATDSEG